MAKKDKSRQKKFDTRIDFTPMVDMNMLLITFFMLCTTMLKSQTLDLVLPTNDNINKEEETKIKESDAITFILDGTLDKDGQRATNGKIYYYEGQPDMENFTLNEIKFGNDKDAIRGMLQKRNKELLDQVNKFKEEWKTGKINDSIYNAKVKEARAKQAEDLNAKRPIIVIKPTANACYADVVHMLDEMQINQISTYQLETLNKQDSTLYEHKVGHALGAQ
ncbi:MAG: biopolymer transporter ExbD [Muribaculaceae bacterium]|nr:biopolymer transporter ExbD [Muribaculaceae bacterium]MDY6293037.1 biopolymer transporter ExbD [Bacteroidales bacterium]MDY6413405.1 biopolymer transporter ExbD [Bacteroidales bacterium]